MRRVRLGGMRALLVIALVIGAATSAEAGPDPLADADLVKLTGCWRVKGRTETWTFRKQGEHTLDVVRELGKSAAEAERARIPQPLWFSGKDNRFAFLAAGRIHGLMIIFTIARGGATLEASVFTNVDGKGFSWSGNNLTAERCTRVSP